MVRIDKILGGAAIAIALTAMPAQAGILDNIDILNLSGITESSLDASNMGTARSVLLNEGASITTVTASSFSASDLTGIDILYVGLAENAFSAAQLGVINSFVGNGGGLVAVGTERSSLSGPDWEEIANSFGLFGLGGDRGEKASAANPASPIVSGPFGVATTYDPAATGAFDGSNLPAGTDIVWEGDDNNPIIVTLDVTGRAFFFADTNFMQDTYIGDGDNSTIWGNAFAFTAQVPEPATLGLFGLGLVGLGLAARRRKTA